MDFLIESVVKIFEAGGDGQCALLSSLLDYCSVVNFIEAGSEGQCALMVDRNCIEKCKWWAMVAWGQ